MVGGTWALTGTAFGMAVSSCAEAKGKRQKAKGKRTVYALRPEEIIDETSGALGRGFDEQQRK